MIELSVCITAHNEEKTISELLQLIDVTMSMLKIEYEVCLLDNGSTDNTAFNAIMSKRGRNFRLIFNRETLSYLDAYKKIVKEASGQYIFIIDADMQYEPIEFIELWKRRLHGYIVTGIKVKREDPFIRKLESLIFNWLASFISVQSPLDYLVNKVYFDMNCGFRLFHNSCKKYVAQSKYLLRSPGTEMLLRAMKDGKWVIPVSVNHFARKYGKSTVTGLGGMFSVFKEQIRGLSLLWKEICLS